MLQRLLMTVAVVVLVGPPSPTAQDPVAAELAKGVRQVQTGDLEAAVLTLDSVAKRPAAQGGRPKDRARAYVYLSVAYLGLGQAEKAKAQFLEALKTDTTLELAANEFPPRYLQFFEEARKEALSSARDAPLAAPTPVPPAKSESKKRGSKVLPIVVGLSAAGAAAAVAAGRGNGGGSSPPSSPDAAPAAAPTTRHFVAADVPKTTPLFPERRVVDSVMDVRGFPGRLTDIRVSVSISSATGSSTLCESSLWMRHPDGTQVSLVVPEGVPGATFPCVNQITATFPTPTAPQEPLTRLVGKTAEGSWILSLACETSFRTNTQFTLQGWSLDMTTQP